MGNQARQQTIYQKICVISATLALLLGSLSGPVLAATPIQDWVASYNGSTNSNDYATALAVDAAGNTYVTGSSLSEYDYTTVKYDTNGNELWVARYNGPGNNSDVPSAIAVDSSGNVYVTGHSNAATGSAYNYDYATVKYDTNGNELWVARYNYNYNGSGNSGGSEYVHEYEDLAYALTVDAAGNVYVTGESQSGRGPDYATIKYDTNGNQLWVTRYNGPGDKWDTATALDLDASGNVYVTGRSWGANNRPFDYATVKYDANGNQQWVARYNGPGDGWDDATALAVDTAGNVYVTGQDTSSTSGAYATIKYDTNGNQLWVARYNGPGDGFDNAAALAVDTSGNVYVTGYSYGFGTSADYATIKYDLNGNQLWEKRYNGIGNDFDSAAALAVDATGNVYVTGAIAGYGTNSDSATIKYDTNGNQLWVARYNGPRNGGDRAVALAMDAAGNVYVTGSSTDAFASSYNYTTIKYSQSDTTDTTPPVLSTRSNLTVIVSSASGGIINYTRPTATDNVDSVVYVICTPASGSFFPIGATLVSCSATDTAENTGSSSFTVTTVQRVDLLPTALTAVISSSKILVQDSVKNQGLGAAGGFAIRYYLSSNTSYDTADRLLCSRSVASLAAGASSPAIGTITTTCPIPGSVPKGSYYVVGVVDAGKVVVETNEANNNRSTTAALLLGSDLLFTALSATTVGNQAVITDNLKNQGTLAAGSFTVGYYLSLDTLWQSTDTVLCSRSVTGLAAGQSTASTITRCATPNLPVNLYYVIARVDTANTVAESLEGNNTKIGSRIAIGPDLLPLSIGISKSGSTLTLTDSLKNQGTQAAGSFFISYYLSSDSLYQSTDRLLCSRSLIGLGAGVSSPTVGVATTACTIPSGLTAGAYRVLMRLDSGLTVLEANEGNNVKATAVTVSVP